MKGKRYTTEDKIRILREADRGEKSIADDAVRLIAWSVGSILIWMNRG
jgi:hypothetical protein